LQESSAKAALCGGHGARPDAIRPRRSISYANHRGQSPGFGRYSGRRGKLGYPNRGDAVFGGPLLSRGRQGGDAGESKGWHLLRRFSIHPSFRSLSLY